MLKGLISVYVAATPVRKLVGNCGDELMSRTDAECVVQLMQPDVLYARMGSVYEFRRVRKVFHEREPPIGIEREGDQLWTKVEDLSHFERLQTY